MRARVFAAMLAAWSMGCTQLMVPTRYDAADAKGNQCRNECHMQCGRDYLSVCLDECYSECVDFNGGSYYPLGSCALFPPKVEKYPVPGKEEIPVPDEMQEAPVQPTAPPSDI
jgi:hypothetical protein